FDPRRIPAYADSHDGVYAHIDANLDRHIANLQRWVRQRSISAQDDGIDAMAEMLRADFAALGFQEAEVVPTSGHPGVWAYYDAGAATTLMVYLMYDVQPVEDNWSIGDPFAGTLVENEFGTVLMARGATNQKGPERAFLNAVESVLAVHGTLPVNLMVLAEGEEELGSMHYPELVSKYEDRLREADAAFFPMNAQSGDGTYQLNLGVKGILYFELEARGGEWGGPSKAEIHGSFKAIVDSPVWRLVQALASLTTPDGNTITVPGYYDDVRAPTEEEMRLVNSMARSMDQQQLRDAFGVAEWIDGLEGREAIMEMLYQPTLNIDGIWGGYTGEGGKTILPHKATAKVDSRLPPGLDPDEALAKIRRHLDAQGFADVKIRPMSGYPAARTSVDAPIVQAMLAVLNKYGSVDSVAPWLAGSAPFYQFTERLGLPLVFGGLGHGSGAHAPDEYMVIRPAPGSPVAGLAEIEKGYVDLLYALAAASRK
ncbi:MAG TPA: M20/M25/M40 family metallo-hydrolase, partial [Gammaproteobacteria bacterium]